MITRTIRNETDYDAALAEIDRLMAADPGTPESGGCGGSAVCVAAGGEGARVDGTGGLRGIGLAIVRIACKLWLSACKEQITFLGRAQRGEPA